MWAYLASTAMTALTKGVQGVGDDFTTRSRHKVYSTDATMMPAPVRVNVSGFSPNTVIPMISAKIMRE